MDIAGLGYRIDGECWICDDDKVYPNEHGGYTEWRLTVPQDERPLFHKLRSDRSIVSLVRYVYIKINGYTANTIRHRCNHVNCINPEHLYESTPATRQHSDRDTICLNCFTLVYVKGTDAKMVRCEMGAYNNGLPFPIEKAFENNARLRPRCPDYDPEEGCHWGKRRYKEMKANLLQPTLC